MHFAASLRSVAGALTLAPATQPAALHGGRGLEMHWALSGTVNFTMSNYRLLLRAENEFEV